MGNVLKGPPNGPGRVSGAKAAKGRALDWVEGMGSELLGCPAGT